MQPVNASKHNLSLAEITSILRQHKAQLQNRYGIIRLAVFGSYARGEQRDDSDIDILVQLGDKLLGLHYFSLVRDIDALFPIKTDVVSQGALKPHYLAVIQKDLHYV